MNLEAEAGDRLALAPDVVLQRFEEKALLLDLQGERVYQLNESGARIAELLVEEVTLEELLARLEAEYEASALALEADVRAHLEELWQQKLISIHKS